MPPGQSRYRSALPRGGREFYDITVVGADKMKLAVSGCPRNCAESSTKDLGATAIDGGKWEVYVVVVGSRVRKGDTRCTVDSHDAVLRYMGRFMQYYRENAKYLERTYDFA